MRKRGEPVNELYDSACELLFAAQRLRHAAADRAAAAAIVATMGCVETMLEAMRESVNAMSRSAATELARRGADAAGVEAELGALADTLAAARARCDEARERTAPTLVQVTLG